MIDAFPLRERALALADSGRFGEAILILRRIVKELPLDYESWHSLGVCLSEAGEEVEAIASFDRALDVIPEGQLPIETWKLMDELRRGTGIGGATLRAGIDRKTARKYQDLGKLRSETKEPRSWRTRRNPFAQDGSRLEEMSIDAPEFEAKTLFVWLCEQHPGC